MADKESPTLDSVLEKALSECGPSSARDAVVIAIHSNFLSAGFECIGIGDKVSVTRTRVSRLTSMIQRTVVISLNKIR